ncbi:MAG: hypothetical protein K2H45_12445, partial [Acetatifactor sp.]|nr:hypothetical protein [Acetatifactor sp.]
LYEEHMRIKRDRLYLRNAAIQEGRQEGLQQGDLQRSRQVIYDFLSRLGKVPKDIRTRVEAEQNGEVLREWYMSVPQVKSFDEFRNIIN